MSCVRTILRLAVLELATALAACSSPNPALYTIAPVAGGRQGDSPEVVLMQQVAVARYLERSQIVQSSENYRLAVMENDWWGEPLAPMIGRVLTEELGQRLPRSNVIADTGSVSVRPDATVELNIQRLDENAAGDLILQAQVAVRFKGQEHARLRSFRFSVRSSTEGVPGEVAAISIALGRLADGIAPMLSAGG
jgi:uncharacterized lipoprotein YmbA